MRATDLGVSQRPNETFDVELWCDSFHEGEWACEQLAIVAAAAGGAHAVEYHHGFQPVHTLRLFNVSIRLTVFGSYKAWSPIPDPISELLKWGKPDIIGYVRTTDELED